MGKIRCIFLICLTTTSLMGKPESLHIHHGKASLHDKGKMTTISTSDKAILHWKDFSIQPNETVHFQQKTAQSAVLNRVIGQKKSCLLGKLTSNGKVYLQNPNGILVGPNGLIKTAGFLATTGQINDEHFAAGKEILIQDLGKGNIINFGTIATPTGDINLVARRVTNNVSGKLKAPSGHVNIGAGYEVLIQPDGPERIFIQPGVDKSISRHMTAIDNAGKINALVVELKTHSNLYAQAIRHGGKITAGSIKKNQGRVYLVAKNSSVFTHGQIQAPGGQVVMTGKGQTRMHPQSIIDVSHPTAPGEVFIGQGPQRKGANYPTAQHTWMEKGASIHANASQSGNGGKVILWSDETTEFFGDIFAESKAMGNGGHVEVSSIGSHYVYRGFTSVKGYEGLDGELLIDPKFASIVNTGVDPATGNTYGSDSSGSVAISGASLSSALETANVTIQANTDIYVRDTIAPSSGSNTLNLQAGRSVSLMNTSVDLNGGDFNIKINDENCIGADRDAGVAHFTVQGLSSIHTHGGDITANVGTFGGLQEGLIVLSATDFDAGGGSINMSSFGSELASRRTALSIQSTAQLKTSGNGNITLTGVGANGANNNYGISIASNNVPAKITAENGNVLINGTAGGVGTSSFNVGCYITGANISTTGIGAIDINGVGGEGLNQNIGVIISGANTSITSENGSIDIAGSGGGTQESNYGVLFESGAQVISAGVASINVTGMSGSGSSSNIGVLLTGASTKLSSVDGDIIVVGESQGFGDLNQGCRIESGAHVTATNAANINFQGTSAPGGDDDNGIYVGGASTAITSVNGNIELTGIGQDSGASNQGIIIEYPSNVESTGSGSIVLNSSP